MEDALEWNTNIQLEVCEVILSGRTV
jgi:hypothetical protein